MPWQLDVKQVTDAAGGFRFEGLAAGEHELLLDDRPGVVTALRETVTLTAGEAREVLLDARGQGTCEVALTIELGRRAAAGLAVFLKPADVRVELHELGTTDEAGRVQGWAPVCTTARVELQLPGGAELLHPDPIGPLELDARCEAHVRFAVGSLRIELPPTLVLPAQGWGSLVLTPADDPAGRTRRGLGLPASSEPADLTLEGHSILCAHVLPGEYELQLELTDAATPLERIPDGPAIRIERPPLYRTTLRATVRADEVTQLVSR